MLSTTVVKFKSKNFKAVLRDGSLFLIMAAVYVGGIAVGVFALHSNSALLAKAEGLYMAFYTARDGNGFISQFGTALAEWLPFLLAVFACGTCVVGLVLAPCFVFYKGICYGALAGYLYSAYSFKGIIFVLFFIIPPTLLYSLSLFLTGACSCRFSMRLARGIIPNGNSNGLYEYFRVFLNKTLFFSLLAFSGALLDALLSSAFFEKIGL